MYRASNDFREFSAKDTDSLHTTLRAWKVFTGRRATFRMASRRVNGLTGGKNKDLYRGHIVGEPPILAICAKNEFGYVRTLYRELDTLAICPECLPRPG